jgi:putative transcriptional regulator
MRQFALSMITSKLFDGAYMAIVVRLDVMLALRKVKSKDLAAHIGITESNLSLLKSGRVRGIRFDTLEKICEFLNCQPGDLIVYEAKDAPSGTQRTLATGS